MIFISRGITVETVIGLTWMVTIASGRYVNRTDFVAARASTLWGSSTFRDVGTSTSAAIVDAAVRNKTTLPIPYRLNQLEVFSCNAHGSYPVLHSHFRSKSGPTCDPPSVVTFSQTESCPHKNGVFSQSTNLCPSGMHLRRQHKITGFLQIINRKSIDAFVRLQCSFKSAEDFMDGMYWHWTNGSETVHFASPTPVLVDPFLPPLRTFSVNSASFRSANCRTSN
jgi:hypothetical protein